MGTERHRRRPAGAPARPELRTQLSTRHPELRVNARRVVRTGSLKRNDQNEAIQGQITWIYSAGQGPDSESQLRTALRWAPKTTRGGP